MDENIAVKVLMNAELIFEDAEDDITVLTDHLSTKLFLNSQDRDFIHNGSDNRTRRAQLERLFDRLLRKDDKVWKEFLEGLKVSENDTLVERISKTNCKEGPSLDDLKSSCRSLFRQHRMTYPDMRVGWSGPMCSERNLQDVLPDIAQEEESEEFRDAFQQLNKSGVLVVTGPDKEQRSVLCQVLLKRFSKEGYNFKPIMLRETKDWDSVKNDVKDSIVLLDDILGIDTLSKIKTTAWCKILKTLPKILLKSQCPLLISLSKSVFEEAKNDILVKEIGLLEQQPVLIMQTRRKRLTSKSQQAKQILSGDKRLPRSLSQIESFPSDLHQACFSGDVSEVQELIQEDEALKNNRSPAGQTPLQVACDQKHVNIACFLLGIGEAALVQYIDGDCLDVNIMLHKAAELGHKEVVKQLLRQGADSGFKNGDEREALHMAVLNNHYDVIEELVMHGTDLHAVDREGCTPLHYACAEGHRKVVALLTEKGVKRELLDKNGMTPLDVACKENKINIAKLLLDRDAACCDEVTEKTKQSALHIASSCNHVDLLKLLISKGAKPDISDAKGCTILHSASENGALGAVEELLAMKTVKVNAVDQGGLTSLHKACIGNHKNSGIIITKLLEHGADKDGVDHRGQSALHHACLHGNIVAISVLLKYNANCMLFDHKLNTPLHVACQSGYPGVVQALLFPTLVTQTGQKITVEFIQNITTTVCVINRAGDTPLHLACRSGLVLAVWALLRQGQIPIDTVNLAGDTALHDACSHDFPSIVKTLLDLKARTDIRNFQGLNALHVAVNNGLKQIVPMLLEAENKLNVAQKQTDFRGRTPIHLASEKGHLQIVKMLIASGYDVNAKDAFQNTALHYASFSGQASIVKCLLDSNADPNTVNMKKESPLYQACYFGNQAIVDMFLDCKALDLSDAEGHFCLEVASKFGYTNIVKSLLRKGAKVIIEEKKYPSPLLSALGFRHLEIAHLILQRECSKTVIVARDEQGDHALNMVCSHGDKKLLALMLKQRPDVNIAGFNGRTPLIYASVNGHVHSVKILIKAGANVNMPDDNAMTSLMHASLLGREKVAMLLLEFKADVNSVNKGGQTALHLACAQGSEGIVQQLINCKTAHKADLINQRDNDQVTPLYEASRNGRTNVVKILLKAGAKVDIPGNLGFLPLHCACEIGSADIVEMLLKAKSSTNQTAGETGSKALFLGCKSVQFTGKMAVVDLLLNHKVKVDSLSLVAACKTGSLDLLIKLLDHVSSNEMQQILNDNLNPSGRAPLHAAVDLGRPDIVEMLVSRGSNVDVLDSNGKSPLFIARQLGHTEIVEFLLNKGANDQNAKCPPDKEVTTDKENASISP